MPTLEIYFSPEYNGWKSPIIKDKNIKEIQDIISKAITKSDEEIKEDNNSVKEDDDKSKAKKSRFIEGSDHLYNFKITEFKQLLIKELGFKKFSSFNKQEKEIKLKEDKPKDDKQKENLTEDNAKDDSDNENVKSKPSKTVLKKNKPEKDVKENSDDEDIVEKPLKKIVKKVIKKKKEDLK